MLLLCAIACNGEDPKVQDSQPELVDTQVTPDTAFEDYDLDHDGWAVEQGDCDDDDGDVHPGADEVCNGLDDNCNGLTDEGESDVDGDGTADCVDEETCDGVDNDGDDLVDEGAEDVDGDGEPDCVDTEACDGVDNDGDDLVDEGFDADGDGFLSCGEDLDCDDDDADAFPGGTEQPDDLVDQDCDGLVDEGYQVAGDLLVTELMVNPDRVRDPDGEYIEIENVSATDYTLNGLVLTDDGDDWHQITSTELIWLAPGEIAVLALNGNFDDNGGVTAVYDYDDVSLSNESDSLYLMAGAVVLDAVSWDDGDTFPDDVGASMTLDPEYHSAEDNDEGRTWCPAPEAWGVATDLGSPGETNTLCPSLDRDGDGVTPEEGDCDESDPEIYYGNDETPYDGIDNDCDELTLDDDLDQDGYGIAEDCDDLDDTVSPGLPEVCDDFDVDEDCSGSADDDDRGVTETIDWYIDVDGDGYGDEDGTPIAACEAPSGYVESSSDCDDTDTAFHPAAEEACTIEIDYNCDGVSGRCDEDGDGFGNDDCDDEDPLVHPYAYEDPDDLIDNDCDDLVDSDDTDSYTSYSFSDDSTNVVNIAGFTFDFCGTSYSSFWVSSNGRITFYGSDTDYSESTTEMNADRSVAGLWDDLYPPGGGSVYVLEHDDAIGVYFRDMAEISTYSPSTFSMVLLEDGRVLLDYAEVGISDGLVGWSCGNGSSGVTTADLSASSIEEGAAGIGQGTEDGYYEYFTSGNDVEGHTFMFCVNSGDDNDGDGWTDECGDTDDDDATVSP